MRTLRKINILLSLVYLLAAHSRPLLSTQEELKYRDRGDRFEGILQPQVAGYDIELLSAIIDYQEPSDGIPPYLKVKFYLKQSYRPFLVARELDVTYHYWMDNVHGHTWQTNSENYFAWPTGEVVQKLEQIKSMYELGVVARLDKERPSKEETIAPIIFYHNSPPSTVDGYLFTFKTNGPSRLTCHMYKEGGNSPIFTQNFPRVWGDQPFTVQWNSSRAEDGWYRLVINGSFRNNNDPVDKVVKFYHKRVVE